MADNPTLTVVVTRKLPKSVEQELSSRYDVRLNGNDVALTGEQMSSVMRSADVLLCTVTDRIRAEHLGAGSRVKLIANFGVGVNHIDLEAARAAGITVTNTPDVLTDDTADLTIGLMLMIMRRMGEGERHVRNGGWSGWRPTHMLGRTLRGKTLGIIGYGRIGRAVARRASSAFGMKVIWYSPRDPKVDDASTNGPTDARRVQSLDELFAESDVISLHCPARQDTHHLINAERFAQMKSTAYLVNTARGDVVDEWALASALRDRMIAGAALDVFEHEPSVVAELRDMENVVLLPHLGSATIETRTAMGERAIANIDAFARGETPPDRVT
jgi:lactate dehydrogenase-like 2-hydroxyacid dehydrogenase